jgi:hypothetical protein
MMGIDICLLRRPNTFCVPEIGGARAIGIKGDAVVGGDLLPRLATGVWHLSALRDCSAG